MTAEPVAELVRRARRGEASAFDELVRRHLRAAYAVALAVLGRPGDAEDVSQDAFVVALERLADCRDPARFSGWLLQIVRNRALHALERRKVREPAGDVAGAATHAVAADVVLRARLLAALDRLSRVQREIVLLHDLDGWTHAELAELLGITEVNCRQHLFTARRALRAELEEVRDGTAG
jgi:RNA polymerase sigma-70 factor (ECF subfamily)